MYALYAVRLLSVYPDSVLSYAKDHTESEVASENYGIGTQRMAEKKKTTTQKKRSSPKTETYTYKKSKSKTAHAKKNTPREKKVPIRKPNGLMAQLMPFVLGIAAVFVAVCLLVDGVGFVGNGLRSVLFGLFSGASYTVPLFLLIAAFMWRADSENNMIAWKTVCFGIAFLITTILMHFFTGGIATFSPVEQYKSGLQCVGGGVVGGVLGELMMRAFDRVLSLVLLFPCLFVFVLLMFGVTPRSLWVLIAYKIKMSRERAEAKRLEKVETVEPHRRRPVQNPEPISYSGEQQPLTFTGNTGDMEQPSYIEKQPKQKFNVDVELDGDTQPAASGKDTPAAGSGVIDEKIFDEVMKRTQQRLAQNGAAAATGAVASVDDDLPWDESIPAERAPGDVLDGKDMDALSDEDLDLSKIFTESTDMELLARLHKTYDTPAADGAEGDNADMDIELSVQRRQLTETVTPPKEEPKAEEKPKEYQFPPITLLTQDEAAIRENVADELRDNAAKLVQTLEYFNVKTKIVDVSRGPTITRYELLPEPGTRVRSIANLVDDIALNLATSGVRIEAPIPGKSAVGIEVPNKKSTTVHLRTLLENPAFTNAKSRISCALGQDVAGANVYLDIARMPHLLIAGATGMGKSVCINSLLISLLYKAKPDELKLILVDPKKVEFNMYNGIPHLYMPVVTDAKKAAGALSWAVSEMERRYSLIEEVGVRDVKSYNEITKNDPEYEFLPQFVIVIDELADLMMMAKTDVEDSICRIAQKARAAGMHLIIGTQRPSVDVITGLIKANFPSRIACRVSSQIDSRTIIDRAGAENLIGRGDMLYNPVGADKPIRVQGAFVSDQDVEKVITYIKTHNSGVEYNTSAIEQVERNAASIGASKKGGAPVDDGDGAGEDDPMLRPAIELAVESGKISTSLIQRRLSLGYGRAAKLIDRMEQLGYVSAPEGQKPREVLITKEQFMEMVLRDTDS